MKLKNIFLVFVLGTIWGLTSCSSEEMIDTPKNGEVTLSFALSVKDDLTKAEKTQIATADELKINNCHIAVFDDQEGSETIGNLITSFDFPEGDESASLNPNEEGVYTLSQSASIRTWGKSRNVKVLAIANVDGTDNKTTTDFKACTTYSAYQSAVVASSSFQSDNLVKVGETTHTLVNGGNNATIEIELTQLTARIDFEGIKDVSSSNVPPSGKLISIAGLNGKSKIVITDFNAIENRVQAPIDIDEISNGLSTFYTYEHESNKIVLTVDLSGKQYIVDLSKSEAQIIKGNRYIIKGTYHPKVSSKIKWVVQDWSSKQEINIGFN